MGARFPPTNKPDHSFRRPKMKYVSVLFLVTVLALCAAGSPVTESTPLHLPTSSIDVKTSWGFDRWRCFDKYPDRNGKILKKYRPCDFGWYNLPEVHLY